MADPVTVATSVSSAGWTTRDCLYLAGVVISSVSAGITVFSARMALKRDNNSLGDSEIKLFEHITACESKLVDFNVGLKKEADMGGENYRIDDADDKKLQFLIECVLNAYDIACQRYIDGKLDKQRFRKTYSARISKVCNSALYRPVISTSGLHYSALSRVNVELNDPEK